MQKVSETMLDCPATVWTKLPEYVLELVVENVQGDRYFPHVLELVSRHPQHQRAAHDRDIDKEIR
jgi:hypothetical protein